MSIVQPHSLFKIKDFSKPFSQNGLQVRRTNLNDKQIAGMTAKKTGDVAERRCKQDVGTDALCRTCRRRQVSHPVCRQHRSDETK